MNIYSTSESSMHTEGRGRGRGLLRLSSGGGSTENETSPGQLHWVSDNWKPSTPGSDGSPGAVNNGSVETAPDEGPFLVDSSQSAPTFTSPCPSSVPPTPGSENRSFRRASMDSDNPDVSFSDQTITEEVLKKVIMGLPPGLNSKAGMVANHLDENSTTNRPQKVMSDSTSNVTPSSAESTPLRMKFNAAATPMLPSTTGMFRNGHDTESAPSVPTVNPLLFTASKDGGNTMCNLPSEETSRRAFSMPPPSQQSGNFNQLTNDMEQVAIGRRFVRSVSDSDGGAPYPYPEDHSKRMATSLMATNIDSSVGLAELQALRGPAPPQRTAQMYLQQQQQSHLPVFPVQQYANPLLSACMAERPRTNERELMQNVFQHQAGSGNVPHSPLAYAGSGRLSSHELDRMPPVFEMPTNHKNLPHAPDLFALSQQMAPTPAGFNSRCPEPTTQPIFHSQNPVPILGAGGQSSFSSQNFHLPSSMSSPSVSVRSDNVAGLPAGTNHTAVLANFLLARTPAEQLSQIPPALLKSAVSMPLPASLQGYSTQPNLQGFPSQTNFQWITSRCPPPSATSSVTTANAFMPQQMVPETQPQWNQASFFPPCPSFSSPAVGLQQAAFTGVANPFSVPSAVSSGQHLIGSTQSTSNPVLSECTQANEGMRPLSVDVSGRSSALSVNEPAAEKMVPRPIMITGAHSQPTVSLHTVSPTAGIPQKQVPPNLRSSPHSSQPVPGSHETGSPRVRLALSRSEPTAEVSQPVPAQRTSTSPHLSKVPQISPGTSDSRQTLSSTTSGPLSPFAPVFVPKLCATEQAATPEDNGTSVLDHVREVLHSLYSDQMCDIELVNMNIYQLLVNADVDCLRSVVDELFTQAVNEQDFRYTGARICAFLSCNLANHVTSFWKLLLERCHVDYTSHTEMVKSADGLSYLANFTLFISELTMTYKATSGSVCDVFSRFLLRLMLALLAAGDAESLTCVVRVLKLAGPVLDIVEHQQLFNEIFTKLRQAIVDASINRSLRSLILSVIEQRASHWGSDDKHPPGGGASAAYYVDTDMSPSGDVFEQPHMNYFDENGFYCSAADGSPVAEEGYGDWWGQDEQFDSSFDFDLDCLEDDEMEPEIAEAFELFLQEQEQQKNVGDANKPPTTTSH